MGKRMQFDYLVVIGRFQPLHNLHCTRIARALSMARRVIVLVGSAHRPRTARNPFTAEERWAMIQAVVASEPGRLLVAAMRDRLYDHSRWVAEVHACIDELTAEEPGQRRIGVMPAEGVHTTRYEQMFPDWDVLPPDDTQALSPSDLRDAFFTDGQGGANEHDRLRTLVPAPVYSMLKDFRKTAEYESLLAEHRHIRDYKRSWSSAPYPPVFVTADAVLIHSNHVLLIRRGHSPGKGLWALPGGFVDRHELLLDAALRELQEETQLPMAANALKRSLVAREVFDYPERSARGRTITHAFCFHVPSGEPPPICGSDDAALAEWVPLERLSEFEAEFFEDHFHILDYFLRTSFPVAAGRPAAGA